MPRSQARERAWAEVRAVEEVRRPTPVMIVASVARRMIVRLIA
jgi:hypothetical protein